MELNKSIPLRAAIYARFSPGSHQTDQSIEGQLRDNKKIIEEQGMILVETYIDRKLTGRDSEKRSDFQRMIRDSDKNMFDVLVVWKRDRFARNRYDDAKYKARLNRNGVKIVSAMESIPETADGIILESVLVGMAEYYSADLREKVMRGMRESAYKCKATGRAPLGYKIGDQKDYVIDPETAPVVREAFRRYAAGEKSTDIINSLNSRGLRTNNGKEFKTMSLHNMLKNSKYIGVYKFGDVEIEGGMPALIDGETWRKVRARMNAAKIAPASDKGKFALTGKLFCGKCRRSMVGESGTGKNGTTHYYYKCSTRKKSGAAACDKKNVKRDWIEGLVVRATQNYVLQDDVMQAIAANCEKLARKEAADNSDLLALQSRLREVNRSLENIIKAIEQGVFSPTVSDRLRKLEEEQADLQIAIEKEKVSKPIITAEQIMIFLEGFRDDDVDDPEVQKRIVDTFIDRIYLYDDKLVITYNTSSQYREQEIVFGTDGLPCSDFILLGAPKPVILRGDRFFLFS